MNLKNVNIPGITTLCDDFGPAFQTITTVCVVLVILYGVYAWDFRLSQVIMKLESSNFAWRFPTTRQRWFLCCILKEKVCDCIWFDLNLFSKLL
jgi:hypothetical protein